MKTESQETGEIVYVKVRIKRELHEKLKQFSQVEERSMNYLMNKAVVLLLTTKTQEGSENATRTA